MSKSTRARTRALAAALPAVLVLAAGCTGTQSAGGADDGANRFVAGDGSAKVVPAAERKAGPQAEGTTLDGARLSLASLRGKVVVVNFWASWCAPCRGEAPTLEQLSQQYKPQGVQFVGLDIRDGLEPAKAFQRTFKVGYPSLFDSDGRLTLAFRDVPPNAVPATLVLDRQGRVSARIMGLATYSKLNPLLKRIAAER